MNKELKEQAHKEFEAQLLDGDKMEDCGKAVITIDQDFIEVFDTIIDKTVQMTEERIVGIIKNAQDNYLDLNSYETYAELESLKSIITNKSDINK